MKELNLKKGMSRYLSGQVLFSKLDEFEHSAKTPKFFLHRMPVLKKIRAYFILRNRLRAAHGQQSL